MPRRAQQKGASGTRPVQTTGPLARASNPGAEWQPTPPALQDARARTQGKSRIGITGGTSTPEVDLEEVRDRIYALTAA